MRFPSLRLPIVLAPMAGGPNTPALAAAVAGAGGIGSFGFAYSAAPRIRADLAATRALTGGVLNANLFVFPAITAPDAGRVQQAIAALSALPGAQGVALPPPAAPFVPDVDAQLRALYEARPDVLTFHFGLPPDGAVEAAHARGICVGVTATRPAEAVAIEAAGADFIVAQGREAGGHCGVFEADRTEPWLPVRLLIPALRATTSLPLIATGGLMTGHDVRAVLDAGAIAAQLGTAFLACDESGASAAHRRYLMGEHARGTVLTRSFSGRWAQGIRNAFTEAMQDRPLLPFPLQNTLTATLRQAAIVRDDGEYQSLWAGQHYSRCRSGPAAQLLAAIEAELGPR